MIHRLRWVFLFGKTVGALPLRPSLQGALTHHMRCVHRLRKLRFLSSRLPDPHTVTSDRSSLKFAGRAHALPLRRSASPSKLHLNQHPTRLTIRSSRPRVVASAVCFALRLHTSAAPPRVGLTQALGGRKAFFKCAPHRLDSPASVCAFFWTDSRRVATSVTSLGALTHYMRCVRWLRHLRLLS